ncbi:MAG: hypothetical protein LQ350_003318 [Teloschistes chrysophthalmus]|nr:MAG: hypothetical protein LQ350_003318 [Niorma chrysophthalma]
MSVQKEQAAPLKPLLVELSMLHLGNGISTLPKTTGNDVVLSNNSTDGAPTSFKVILMESTTRSLVLESFYNEHIAGKCIDGVTYTKTSLGAAGISRVAFSTTLGRTQGQDPLHDRTSPGFKVKGFDSLSTASSFDHIFGLRQFESKFFAVLGLDFLAEHFIRAQWTAGGFLFRLPQLPPAPMSELVVYTDGCFLSNGQTQERPARAGYGIHFPQLSRDWDLSNQLSAFEKHTNQRAELLAVIRALQVISARRVPCQKISIFTDSEYAVRGLKEWIPKWRTNGYRTAQKKPVGNADIFKILDSEACDLTDGGVLVEINHIPREENSVADRLAKAGAQGPPGSPDFSIRRLGDGKHPVMTLGREVFDQAKPLAQYTPDGYYWVQESGTRGQNENDWMKSKFLAV